MTTNTVRCTQCTSDSVEYHVDGESLCRSCFQRRCHKSLEDQLAAATARADDAERERDAALEVLREVEKAGPYGYEKQRSCPSCLLEVGLGHAPDCALAACLDGGAESDYPDPVDPDAHLMTLADWRESVRRGGFIDYDGHGYPVKDGMQSMESYPPSSESRIPSDATHINWYNR